MTLGENGFARTLTAQERSVLLAALDSGYFAVPRHTTLTEVADEVGLGDKETLAHLHRGLETVLRNHREELEEDRRR